MKHIESLRRRGWPVKLGKHGLIMTKNTPPDLRAKILAASSIIVRELIEESDPPLIRAIRNKRRAICQSCGEDTDLMPYDDDPEWHYYDCACGDCRTVHVTDPRLIQDTILLTGKCVIESQALGDIVTLTVDDSIPGDYTLQELLRIDLSIPGVLQTIHNVKRAFQGAQVVAA